MLQETTCAPRRPVRAAARVAAVACAAALAFPLAGCSAGAGSTAPTTEGLEGLDELGAVTVVAREEGSGTRSVFSENVGLIETDEAGSEVDVTTDDAVIGNDAEEVIAAVAADESAIGYVSLGAVEEGSGVKVVAVNGVEPTAETVEDGSYLLSRDFYIAYCGSATDVEADFLKFILSAGQDVVADGYVPVDDVTLFLSDQSEGVIDVSGSTSVAPLMEALAEAYLQLNPNATITVTATDSTSGLTAAMTEDSDWGMSSRELETYEDELLASVAIASDAVAVIVNEDSPVESLTVDQLRQLFSGEVESWSELG